ncbi:MAG: hexokinase [Treponema sp.]|jgi:hexokinase|nr:hexokinase [Treponema sp.]
MRNAFDSGLISEFARHYGFHYDRVDPHGLVDDVLVDMERGLEGQSSSLPMIPAYISPVSKVPSGKTVIALDAGGTNLRAALVKFDDNGKVREGANSKVPMPGTRGSVGAEEFFDEIAGVTAPLIRDAPGPIEGIGFCFSYPMEITSDADGILMAFSKEVDAPEVIGKAIGRGLRDALARLNLKVPGRIVLLNDTVATLLSGLLELPAACEGAEGRAGPVVGCILGTGFNTAYSEKSIPKIGFESASNPQIVVCETGAFAHRYMGALDREFDRATNNPGAYTLEKAAAGAYLGPLTLHILKQAVRDGVLACGRSGELLAMESLQTKDLNAFLRAPFAGGILGGLFGKDEEAAMASLVRIASIVTERGALFAAAMTAGAVIRAGGGCDPLSPARIAMEGTTYLVYHGMRTAMESWLHVMLARGTLRSYLIAPVEQASLFGAAAAALTE